MPPSWRRSARRPRLYWPTWPLSHDDDCWNGTSYGELQHNDTQRGYVHVTNPSSDRIPVEEFLDEGVTKCDSGPFPTSDRWIPRTKPPEFPRGIEDCDPATLENWEANEFAMPPYQYKRELGVVTSEGEERPPNADERERLHGFRPGHTKGFTEHQRISFLGNSFHCIVIAYLLASWAVEVGYLSGVPSINRLWANAGYGDGSDRFHAIGPQWPLGTVWEQ